MQARLTPALRLACARPSRSPRRHGERPGGFAEAPGAATGGTEAPAGGSGPGWRVSQPSLSQESSTHGGGHQQQSCRSGRGGRGLVASALPCHWLGLALGAELCARLSPHAAIRAHPARRTLPSRPGPQRRQVRRGGGHECHDAHEQERLAGNRRARPLASFVFGLLCGAAWAKGGGSRAAAVRGRGVGGQPASPRATASQAAPAPRRAPRAAKALRGGLAQTKAAACCV